jgi:hypothetical protein
MVDADQDLTQSSDDAHMFAGPLVFISHDSRDATLAEAFSKLLSNVSAGILKTFRSSDKKGSTGFEYGVEWYPELMKKIESAGDVVCLLTERSLERPWILYEAGVAKGKLAVPVYGLALGVSLSKASTGPFAQFQNCGDDLESLTKLVVQLVRRLPHADPNQEMVRAQVEMFKSRVDAIVASRSIGTIEEDSRFGEASTSKFFEEIKVMFRELLSRLDRVTMQTAGNFRVVTPSRNSPKFLDDVIMVASGGECRAGIAALVIGSLFCDDYPWLYGMSVEVYRASIDGDAAREKRALIVFMRAIESMTSGPFSRELGTRDVGGFSRLLHRYLDELDEFHEKDNFQRSADL